MAILSVHNIVPNLGSLLRLQGNLPKIGQKICFNPSIHTSIWCVMNTALKKSNITTKITIAITIKPKQKDTFRWLIRITSYLDIKTVYNSKTLIEFFC